MPPQPRASWRPLYAPREALTIIRQTAPRLDPQALALAVVGWVVADERRAGRLLALTGLTPDDLRGGLGDPALLGAVLDFLLGHEADTVAAAAEIGVRPEDFAAARASLAR